MPLPNDPLGGDTFNTQGFLGTIRAPLTSNNYVARIDHDFSDKLHFYVTYRDYHLRQSYQQPGGYRRRAARRHVGTAVCYRSPAAAAVPLGQRFDDHHHSHDHQHFRVQLPAKLLAMAAPGRPPQLPGLGGALEIGGESSNALIPYNVNTQSVRQRFWDGQDKMFRDDLTMIKGNHLFGFGGSYQRNFDYHSRSDNGSGVNNQVSYLSTNSGFVWLRPMAPIRTFRLPSWLRSHSSYETLYAEALGMLSSTAGDVHPPGLAAQPAAPRELTPRTSRSSPATPLTSTTLGTLSRLSPSLTVWDRTSKCRLTN